MKSVILIFLLHLLNSIASAQEQNVNELLQSGNRFFNEAKYEQAAAEYAKAMAAEPTNTTAKFNYASAMYKAGKQVEASKSLTELAATVTAKDLRARAFYNRGVILSAQKNLEESIEAYKNALRQDPADQQARENLQKALLELKKKETPKPKQQEQQQKKNQQQQQQQSKMNQKEADQRLKLLQQKEKEVQQRLQKEKASGGGGTGKDW